MGSASDIDDLARRYLELWDRQAAHMASDPAAWALLAALSRRSDASIPIEPADEDQ